MSFNMSLQSHVYAVRDCLAKFAAKAEFRFGNYTLEVRSNGRYYEFIPQFATYIDGKVAYTPHLSPDTHYFIGWRHYFNRRWELSNHKLAFKNYCQEHGLSVPKLFQSGEGVDIDVILKAGVGSFGVGIEGPFTPVQARRVPMKNDCYFEEFVRGDIAKIWYWNDKVVALETKPMVQVHGNGRETIRELIENIASRVVKVDWPLVTTLIEYQGFAGLDDVAPDGVDVMVDFRYMSGLHPVHSGKLNVLPEFEGTPTMHILAEAGPLFWQGIPENLREDTLYTIDAIIRPNGQVAFLEMNSNPVVHVDAYQHMFASLFNITSNQPAVQTPMMFPPMPPIPTRDAEPRPIPVGPAPAILHRS